MTLRKSDKIIAIVGVIILIIAGIGIFIYMDTEDDNGDRNGGSDKMKFFTVDSEMNFNSLPDKTESKIKIKVLRGADFSFKHEIIDENVKNITVTVKYTDENPGLLGRLLKNLGKDTLTVNVVDSEGNKVGSGTQTGSGTIEFDIVGTAKEISDPIEAETYEDAKFMLEEKYEQFSETYTFKFNVKGKLFGALRERLLGKDSVKLMVSYCTYDYDIKEPMDDDDDDPYTEMSFDPPAYHTTNFPGYH